MTAVFPRNGKIFPGFSTQWKKGFHAVEIFSAALNPEPRTL
mgnify:CR=1 FL=1